MAAVDSAQPHWRRPSFVTTTPSPGILTKKKQPSRGWAPQSGSEAASLPYKHREDGGGTRLQHVRIHSANIETVRG